MYDSPGGALHTLTRSTSKGASGVRPRACPNACGRALQEGELPVGNQWTLTLPRMTVLGARPAGGEYATYLLITEKSAGHRYVVDAQNKLTKCYL